MRGERDALSRRVRVAVAVLSLALLAAACDSGDAEDAATTAADAGTTDTVPSTTAAPETTRNSTSLSTSSTTSSSTSTSTTVDPVAQAEADIREAIALAQDTFSACLVAMPSCDPSTLAVARAGDLLERNVARINEWNAAGYTVRNRNATTGRPNGKTPMRQLGTATLKLTAGLPSSRCSGQLQIG